MAITWTAKRYTSGAAMPPAVEDAHLVSDHDILLTGTGTLAAAGVSNSPDLGCRPFATVQVLRTSGAITGQIESDNSGADANFAAPYDETGTVLPALFSALAASRVFGNPRMPAARRNRFKITAGAEGFDGTVYIYASRRGE